MRLHAVLLAASLPLLVGSSVFEAGFGGASTALAQEVQRTIQRELQTEILVEAPEAIPKRKSDPIPPLAIPLSDVASLTRVPSDVKERDGLQLDRKHHQLLVLRDGRMTRQFSAEVGTTSWETPAGRFRGFEKVKEPV